MNMNFGVLGDGRLFVSTHEVGHRVHDEIYIDPRSWTWLYPCLAGYDQSAVYGPGWFHNFAPPPSEGLRNWVRGVWAFACDLSGQNINRHRLRLATWEIMDRLWKEYPEFKPSARLILTRSAAMPIEIEHTPGAPFLSHCVRFNNFQFAWPTCEKPDVACWYDDSGPPDEKTVYVPPPNDTVRGLIEAYVANPSGQHFTIFDALLEQYGGTYLTREEKGKEPTFIGIDDFLNQEYHKAVADESK